MIRSKRVALVAIFATLHVVLYLSSFGLWRNYAIYIESFEGIVLGPYAGFMAAFAGSVIGRAIKPDSFWMFGIIAESTAVLACGLLARGNWKMLLAGYVGLLASYFIHPFGTVLPLWTVADILVAPFFIYPAAKLYSRMSDLRARKTPLALALISFVGIATDSLLRVFLLIPVGLHTFFFTSYDALYAGFVLGAIDSYIEDVLAVVVAFSVGVSLLVAVRQLGLLNDDNS